MDSSCLKIQSKGNGPYTSLKDHTKINVIFLINVKTNCLSNISTNFLFFITYKKREKISLVTVPLPIDM